MKHLYKQCKNTQQVVSYLNSIGLDGYVDNDCKFDVEFDHDGWIDSSETKGASIQITNKFEVYVLKYTKRDVEILEAELKA